MFVCYDGQGKRVFKKSYPGNNSYVGMKCLTSHGLYLRTFAIVAACVAVALHKMIVH